MKKYFLLLLLPFLLAGCSSGLLGGQRIETGTLTIKSLANTLLAVDGSGNVIATTTSGGVLTETDPIWTADKPSYITSVQAGIALADYLTTANAALTYQPIGSYLTTISGLNISQLVNDANYITSTSVTTTNLTVANFTSPNISQWTNNSGYISSTALTPYLTTTTAASTYLTTYNSSTALALFSGVSSTNATTTNLTVNSTSTLFSLIVNSISSFFGDIVMGIANKFTWSNGLGFRVTSTPSILGGTTIESNANGPWARVQTEQYWSNDFLNCNTGAIDPWSGSGVSSGNFTFIGTFTSIDRPGICSLYDSTTAGGGYVIRTEPHISIKGGEETNAKIYFNSTTSNSSIVATTTFGFFSGYTSIGGDNDAMIITVTSSNTTLTAIGKTSRNAVSSSTNSTFNLALATWYNFKIKVNSNATRVDYYIYSSTGTQLWTDYLTTNMAGVVGCGIKMGESSTTAAAPRVSIDFIDLSINRVLNR